MVLKWFNKGTSATDAFEAGDPRRQAPGAWAQHALETVAFLLRAFGNGGWDTDTRGARELATSCDTWSKHVLDGGGPSDWQGIRKFFRDARNDEYAYVMRFRQDMHTVMADIVSGLGAAVANDAQADDGVRSQLTTLLAAAEKGDLDQLRDRARHAVTAVEGAMREREARHKAHLEQLNEQVTRMQADLDTAIEEAETDGLTLIYNRKSFDRAIMRMLNAFHQRAETATLLMLDVDHFKRFNDTHGHRAGDAVLVAVAGAVRKACGRRNDFVARYGGEEFAVLLKDTDLQGGAVVAQRLLERVRALKVHQGGKVLSVTMSIGVSEVAPGDAVDRWVNRADAALYRAKDGGRDRFEVAEPAPAPAPNQ